VTRTDRSVANDPPVDGHDAAVGEDGAVAEDPSLVAETTGATGGSTVGTAALREVVEMARDVAPRRSTIRDDTIAGVVGAIGRVPDGMAAAVLAGRTRSRPPPSIRRGQHPLVRAGRRSSVSGEAVGGHPAV
jgi:hypothetical protein